MCGNVVEMSRKVRRVIGSGRKMGEGIDGVSVSKEMDYSTLLSELPKLCFLQLAYLSVSGLKLCELLHTFVTVVLQESLTGRLPTKW